MIAGYRIVGTLERGNSWAVFRAEAPDGNPVIMSLERPSGQAALVRSRARAERLEDLSHPALARVTGFGEAPEGIWVATAAVEGTTLRGLIDRGIPPMRAVRLLGEVADGLDAAHRAGLPHGDVRAENVIVRGRPVEQAVLTGFPINSDGAQPSDDVAALEALLRECVPDAPPAATRRNAATARTVVAGAAQALLHPEPPEPPEHPEPPWRPEPAPVHRVEKEPAAPKPERRGTPGVLKVAGALLLIAAAAAGGYALSEPSQSNSPPPPSAAAAGPLTVAVPSGWETTGDGRTLRQLEDRVVLTRRSPPGTIVAGVAKDRSSVLDPSTLAEELAGRAPRPREVRVERLPALRFADLRGEGPSVLYVASTSKGAPAVACSGGDIDEPCAQAAAGLAVRGARAYDPAAGVTWKNRLVRDMRRLRARRARGLRRLRAAAAPARQADAANGIARAYASAARSTRRRDAPPQAARARRRLLGRLLGADRAYRSLARAADADNEAAFGRAQRRVRRADRRLRVTLRSL